MGYCQNATQGIERDAGKRQGLVNRLPLLWPPRLRLFARYGSGLHCAKYGKEHLSWSWELDVAFLIIFSLTSLRSAAFNFYTHSSNPLRCRSLCISRFDVRLKASGFSLENPRTRCLDFEFPSPLDAFPSPHAPTAPSYLRTLSFTSFRFFSERLCP